MTAKIHGRLGALDCAATTAEAVYTVPADRKATVSINICNRNSSPVTIRLMHLDGAIGTLANNDYIEYGLPVPATGSPDSTIERTGIAMTAGHTIGFYSSATGVTVQVVGVEEDV